MKSDARWMAKLAGRILANALLGGILTGLLGALCLGAAGASILPVMGLLNRRFPNPFPNGYTISPEPPSYIASLLLFSGAHTGLIVGSLVGALIFGVATFQAPTGRLFAPITKSVGRVTLGQILGTLSALISFGIAAAFKTQVQGQPLFNVTTGGYDDIYLTTLSLGTILFMICGAIAGALWKFDKQKGKLTSCNLTRVG